MQPPNQSLQCLRRSNTFVFCLFLPSDSVALPAFSSCLLFSPRWECSFRDASGSSPAAGGTGLDHHRCTGQDKTPRERKTQIAVHPGALAFLPVLPIKGALLLMGSVFKRWTSKNTNAEIKQTTQYFGEEPLPQTRNYFSKP